MEMEDIGNWALGHGGRRNNAGRKTMRIPTALVSDNIKV